MELNKEAVKKGSKYLCEDAQKLLEMAYHIYKDLTFELPQGVLGDTIVSNIVTVSLEGINNAGKTTQVKRIAKKLDKLNPVIPPRFYDCVPSRIIFGKSQGNFYEMFSPVVDSLLIGSACLQKYHILNELGAHFVLSDRSMDSLYVFQGRKLAEVGHDIDEAILWLKGLVSGVDKDKFRFYLNITIDECERRSFEKYKATGRPPLKKEYLDELKNNLKIYKKLFEDTKREYIVINAHKPIESITNEIIGYLKQGGLEEILK
ncbi:MAG: hypothetical protein HQ534_14310 [Armatimonadetes bacterium]|nr:hypothetical protein [Armatimonadota bacterium]